MSYTSAAVSVQKPLIDALEYLPKSAIINYKKGQRVFDWDRPSKSLYLILSGQVKVCQEAAARGQVIIDIYQTEEFFGESALISSRGYAESAIALDNVTLMSWTVEQIESIMN